MEPGAFAATHFALTPSVLPPEIWIPDISTAVKVYPTINITFNFEKSLIPMHIPENLGKNWRYRRDKDSFEQCLKVTADIWNHSSSSSPKVILYERLWQWKSIEKAWSHDDAPVQIGILCNCQTFFSPVSPTTLSMGINWALEKPCEVENYGPPYKMEKKGTRQGCAWSLIVAI